MKKTNIVLVLSLLLFPLSTGAMVIENVQVSASNSGGITNTTSATAEGGDTSATVYVQNVVNNKGSSTKVHIETGADQERRVETYENTATNGISVEVHSDSRVATTTELEETSWFSRIFLRNEEENSEQEVATSTKASIYKFWEHLLRAIHFPWL